MNTVIEQVKRFTGFFENPDPVVFERFINDVVDDIVASAGEATSTNSDHFSSSKVCAPTKNASRIMAKGSNSLAQALSSLTPELARAQQACWVAASSGIYAS